MDTEPGKPLYLLSLIPHGNTVKILHEYRDRLFARGIVGAYSFPAAAPLACLSRPFSREELKEFGTTIRSLTLKNDGKIQSTGTALVNIPFQFSFFGLVLDITLADANLKGSFRDKINLSLFPPALCAGIVEKDFNPPRLPGTDNHSRTGSMEEAPFLSFRAAALANLKIRPLKTGVQGYSFEWIMGPLVWLPKHKKV